ncbi:hypothetical protein SAMN05216225_104121 [Ornithinibacillus halophilus]|uniref:Uncharacterized protein n=2 Tax=Ornithinibacillus halophilus TaxID=930117 RepID=A0A1M5KU00_9BACI|nr:hypothetical protein SAMN05216225_104121 [Ornithinibacillus halophilus]
MIFLMTVLAACTNSDANNNSEGDSGENESSANAEEETTKLINNIELSLTQAHIGETVEFTADQLEPNEDYQIMWNEYDGHFELEGLYTFVGPQYTDRDIVLVEGTSNDDGVWEGSFEVPDGFGGNHNVVVAQGDTKIGQTGFFVIPTFSMEPESGPVGTEIKIKAKGLGYDTYKSMWQLTYDNKYTGAITGMSTNGTTVAKIRATGHVGDHHISVRSGYLGSPYINFGDSPHARWPAPDFTFTVTDEEPIVEDFVEEAPEGADGGVEMPALENKDGVEVVLEKEEGIVGEENSITASGLPENEEVEIIWNTMVGSRVSGNGFDEDSDQLATVTTDADGNLTYDFEIPDDLGGIPHRMDVVVGDEVYAQAYLRILPSIVSIEPKSGPVGTPIKITIKGGGWTEFDNAYYMTYDNAYMGYMCSFNSQGTLEFTTYATGEPGHHLMDLYPGLYMQKEKNPLDMTLIPQLTYSVDHPGSGMPAVRMSFEVTE